MSSKKWIKAQELEPLHWLQNKNKIADPKYQTKIKLRSEHIFNKLNVSTGPFTGNENVLEIGGGATPLVTFTTFKYKFLVDPLMNFYRENFPMVFPENIDCKNAKGEDLPYEDNKFDLIISRNVLDHVDDVHQCLKEIKRVLRVNGTAYIGMNVFAGPLLVYKTIFKDPEHPYTFSRKSFITLITQYFSIVEMRKNDPINDNHFKEMEDASPVKSFLRNIFLKVKSYAIIELTIKNNK
jgi:ubiquinone/menaquinone biosynthesis C-methylase UbiE